MSVSVGLNCPSCGGAIQVDEGENVVNCKYCGSLLWAEGDAGGQAVDDLVGRALLSSFLARL